MPKLKTLSGRDVVAILEIFGFSVEKQKGSHVKLARLFVDGTKQTFTIPLHKEIDYGTLKAIFNQASRYIPEDKLREHFYTQ
jgi:predicted RNA binding protein YcfA (HicA-like mRNA interferase family)